MTEYRYRTWETVSSTGRSTGWYSEIQPGESFAQTWGGRQDSIAWSEDSYDLHVTGAHSTEEAAQQAAENYIKNKKARETADWRGTVDRDDTRLLG